MAAIRRKLVIVGDAVCGKSDLITVFLTDQFPEVSVPTVMQDYVKIVKVDGKVVELALWDTNGQEDYDRLRPLAYPDTDVILLCFAIDSPGSLENVAAKWAPEVTHFCPTVPFLLIGCRKDLRHDDSTRRELAKRKNVPVSFVKGRAMAEEVGAYDYLECSSKLNEGVKEVFECATRVALDIRNSRRKKMESLHKLDTSSKAYTHNS